MFQIFSKKIACTIACTFWEISLSNAVLHPDLYILRIIFELVCDCLTKITGARKHGWRKGSCRMVFKQGGRYGRGNTMRYYLTYCCEEIFEAVKTETSKQILGTQEL